MAGPQCRRCGIEPTDSDAERCPTCGHDPRAKHTTRMRLWGILTALLCLSLVGLPLAPLTFYFGHRHRTKIKRGPFFEA